MQLVLQARSAMVIGREASRGRKDTLRGTPMGTLLDLNPKGPGAIRGLVQRGRLIRRTRAERPIRTLVHHHENPRVSGSKEQAVWLDFAD